MQQYVGFNIKSTEYMIPILTVREIIAMPSITALPQFPGLCKWSNQSERIGYPNIKSESPS